MTTTLTLVDLFENGARLNSEAVAVIYDDGKDKHLLTYGQLVSAVQHVCLHLYNYNLTT